METLPSTSGYAPDAPFASAIPRTPPETPRQPRFKQPTKRHLERSSTSNSPATPASPASIHPTETISPAKPTPKPAPPDTVRVEELVEGDPGYLTDANIVHPAELEEATTNSEASWGADDDEYGHRAGGGSDGEGSDTGISRRFSRLGYVPEEETQFLSQRRRRHRHKRRESRLFKRPHSLSVISDTEAGVDADCLADQDNKGSARRLRRRVHGPRDDDDVFMPETPVPARRRGGEMLSSGGHRRMRATDGRGGDDNDDDDEEGSSDEEG